MGHVLRVYLSGEEKIFLENLVNLENHPSHLIQRARILLLADRTDGKWNRYEEIAEVVHSTTSTISSVCRQYVMSGLEVALNKKAPSGHVIKITKETKSHLASLILSEPPKGQRYWTLKLLSEQLVELGLVDSISEVAVYKCLKKMNLNTKILRSNISVSISNKS